MVGLVRPKSKTRWGTADPSGKSGHLPKTEEGSLVLTLKKWPSRKDGRSLMAGCKALRTGFGRFCP